MWIGVKNQNNQPCGRKWLSLNRLKTRQYASTFGWDEQLKDSLQ